MNQELQSVYDIITSYANEHGQDQAAIGTDVNITYEQLVKDIDHVSRFILSQGLTEDARVSLIMESTYMHVVFILALDRLGITSNSYIFEADRIMPQTWWQDLGFECIFSTEEKPKDYKGQWVTIHELPRAPSSIDVNEIPIDRSPQRIVRLMFSSGTTGIPKVIPLSREMIMKRMSYLPYMTLKAGEDRHFIGMPLDNAGGYISSLTALTHGCAIIPWANDENFLNLINLYQPCYLLLTPMTLRNIAIDGVKNNYKLDFVEWVSSGGMIFDRRLKDSIAAVFGNTVWNGYGSTEAWAVAIGMVHEYEDATPYLIGEIMPEVDVQIVDKNNQLLPIHETGIVRIKSDFVIQGYENDADNSSFYDGFFYPGDLGMLDNKNRLSILGRVDDLINIGGQKIVPEPIEYELMTLPEIKEAAVFQAHTAEGVRVCAALVLDDNAHSPDQHSAIIKKVQTHLDRLTPQRIFFVAALPRNGMGKIMRHVLAKSLTK